MKLMKYNLPQLSLCSRVKFKKCFHKVINLRMVFAVLFAMCNTVMSAKTCLPFFAYAQYSVLGCTVNIY